MLFTNINPESFEIVSRGTDVEVVMIRTATKWIPALTFQSEYQNGRIFCRIQKQRGGYREFSSLDSAALFLEQLGLNQFKIYPLPSDDFEGLKNK